MSNNKDFTVKNNIVVGGTVDGRDLATDGTKLDAVEAGADVTDVTNVTAAGALMDSELTNIAAIKALNQGLATTDSPTFATVNATTFAGDGASLTGISPHKPVAVTGATPSLNVGTYNFFDQGSMTVDTTVSFASVPTDARWSYSFSLDSVAVPWDVSTATYRNSFDVSAQETSPRGVFFKPDGTKMYAMGPIGDDVNEYDLSKAWDVSTAAHLQVFSVGAQDTAPVSIFFKPDGLKMYVLGQTGDDVNEYDLSTAWDVSTAVYLQLFSVNAQDATPFSIFFKPDGLKMYMVGTTGDSVYEYDLSTAWNVTTASFLQSFSVSAQEANPYGLFLSADGTKMYVAGVSGDDINEYDLSTAWDVSTAVFLQLFYIGDRDSTPYDLFFKPDGSRVYVVGATSATIYAYDLANIPAITLPAAVVGLPNALSAYDRVTYEFQTDDAGTTVNLISEEVIPT